MDSYTIHSRQHELIAPRLRDSSILIYGAGMLGSWTSLALARLAQHVEVWDGGDFVEDVNIGTQAYSDIDVGLPKGAALCNKMQGFNVSAVDRMFPPADRFSMVPTPHTYDVVVACADTMDARGEGEAWAFRHTIPLFIDTRARGLEATIITVMFGEHDRYVAALPSDEDIEPIPCGQNGTAFVGMFVASRVASLLNIYFREGNADTLPLRESWNVERGILIAAEHR